MKPSDIFDICLDQVRRLQAVQERIGAIRGDACAKDGPRRVGNVLTEYIADFELCGKRVLASKPARVEFFIVYFVRNTPYADTCKLLKLRPGTMDWWAKEIKKEVGRELARVGLFPPKKYGEKEVDLEPRA